MTDAVTPIPQKKRGRPSKHETPRLPLDDVDRLLVCGEASTHESTGLPTVRFPSHRELAARFGVSHTTIDQYASRHDCKKRREEVQARAHAKADTQVVELRAKEIVLSSAEALKITDGAILIFDTKFKEGKVRCDTVTDFNTLVRLKLLLMGEADGRQEILGGLSLEALQNRYRELHHEGTPLPPRPSPDEAI